MLTSPHDAAQIRLRETVVWQRHVALAAAFEQRRLCFFSFWERSSASCYSFFKYIRLLSSFFLAEGLQQARSALPASIPTVAPFAFVFVIGVLTPAHARVGRMALLPLATLSSIISHLSSILRVEFVRPSLVSSLPRLRSTWVV